MAVNASNSTNHDVPLNIPYVVSEILVAVFAVIGNALVILVFHREKRLRRRTNYYIVSLAIADLLVGLLGIPFAILASVGLPTNLYACLFTVSLLVVLCTISIFCLVAVSVDRYWAILHPMEYSRNVSTKTAIAIIGVCWVSGTLVGFLPLFGWHRSQPDEGMRCLFTKVMDYDYLTFLYFATIVSPALLMAAFYAHIYRVVLNQLRRIVTMHPSGTCSAEPSSGGTMLRMLGPVQKREVKAAQNLSIIVLFFIVCWIPLYTINCVQAFCPYCDIPLQFTNFCIILSHANSAVNPLLYAYHLRDFRSALKSLLCCLFGTKEDNAGNYTQDRRFGSHNTLQQHGATTPTRTNSLLSLQNVRTLQQQRLYTECPTLCAGFSTSTTPSVSNSHSPVGSIIANMNSIHQAITDLPFGEETDDIQNGRRRMWTLTEVSSCCEDDKHASSGHLALEHRGETCVQRRSSTKRTAGQVNSAYIEDHLVLDYTEDDDDVFVSGTVGTWSPNMAVLSETPFVGNTITENRCDIIQNLGKGFPHQSMEQLELGVQLKGSISNENPVVTSFPEYSSRLHRPISLATCDTDIGNKTLDDHDKTELSPSLSGMKEVIVANSDGTNFNNAEVLRLGSENNVDSAEISDKNRTSISSENLRLSPLKIVGEFLFQTNSKKSTRLKEGVSDDSCELKKDDGDLKVSCDSHSTRQMQRLKDSETVQENGSVFTKCEVTKCVDDMAM